MNVWLFIHLLGVVLFVGNIVTAAFWKVRADLSGNAESIHAAAKNVMLADYAFTLPGIVLITVSGIIMAQQAGWAMNGFNWLTVSLAVFGATGILWAAVLIPVQRALIRHSAEGMGEAGSGAYRRASRIWATAGIFCTLLPVAILYLMVSRSF